MKTRFFRFIFVFSFLLLSACQDHDNKVISEITESPTNTTTVIPGIKGSAIPSTATITPIPSLDPSLTSGPYGVQKDCFSLSPSFQQNANPHSILLLAFQTHYTYLDLDTGNLAEIPGYTGFLDMQISPNQQKIAYHDFQAKQIVVMTENNKILRRIPWEESWITLSRWQNNEELLILTKELLQSSAPNPPNVLLVLNTVTNQSRKLIPDFPHIAQGYILPWRSGHTVYDPTLTRVIYAQTIGESENYVLWNIEENKELISLRADTRGEPVWSPDGSAFIVFTMDGLTLVSRDGIIIDTIDFNKTVDTSINKYKYAAWDFRWSPNGRRVAFWLAKSSQSGDGESSAFVIWDTSSAMVTDTCIDQGDELPGSGWYDTHFVWSPKGDQIVVYANYRASEKTWDVMVVDVERKEVVKIAEDLFPVGWILKAP